MSIHPSLKSSQKSKKQRSILKRSERLRVMLDKEQWKPGDKVWGLPKIKAVKLKIKKEKAAEKPEEAAAAAGAEGAAPAAPAAEGKEKAPAKGASKG